MSDIVDRLNDSLSAGYSELRKEAAQEILQLRKERDALQAKVEAMEQQKPVGRAFLCVRCSTPFDGEHCCPAGGNHTATEETVYATPGAQPAPSVPDGFSREDLEAVADGLDGYEKTVNVGNVTGEGDDHLESTTAYAARFIRAMLAALEAKP